MTANPQRFCSNCNAVVDAIADNLVLGAELCGGRPDNSGCGAPLPIAEFYNRDGFACLVGGHLRPLQELRDRLGSDPLFDPGRIGIYCNEHYPGRSFDRLIVRSDEKERLLPACDFDVLRAVDATKRSILAMGKQKKRWWLERYERIAERNRAAAAAGTGPRYEDFFFANVLNKYIRMARDANWRWQRQVVLCHSYIVDFFNPAYKFVIEIDGSEHDSDPQLFRDQVRDRHLTDEGYVVMRIWNSWLHGLTTTAAWASYAGYVEQRVRTSAGVPLDGPLRNAGAMAISS